MLVAMDYAGRRVRLTDERLAHILEHPEMGGLEAAIPETLVQPEWVVQSVSDPDVHLYYRFYRRTPVGDKWLCVATKLSPGDAFVVTAYLTDRIKTGVLVWQRVE